MKMPEVLTTLVLLVLTAGSGLAQDFSKVLTDDDDVRIFRAARDGFEVIHLMMEKQLPANLYVGELENAQKTFLPHVRDDPKYLGKPAGSPVLTSADLRLVSRPLNGAVPPTHIHWEEWEKGGHAGFGGGSSSLVHQTLLDARLNIFAYNGGITFRLDPTLQDRDQFVDVQLLPDGWSSFFAAAVTWRSANEKLFKDGPLDRDGLAALHGSLTSENPLVRKMAGERLFGLNALSEDEIRAWLKHEPAMEDAAVAMQIVLTHVPKSPLVMQPAWMVGEGASFWCGALIAADLLFSESEAACKAVLRVRVDMLDRKSGSQVSDDQIKADLEPATSQVGFQLIEGIGNELVRTGLIKNYPPLTLPNRLLVATRIIDDKFLFFSAPQAR